MTFVKMRTISLKSNGENVFIGDDCPIIVNCNIGANTDNEYNIEKEKIDYLLEHHSLRPDTMMDLSIKAFQDPLAKYIAENLQIPVGIVPAYSVFDIVKGISKERLFEHIIKSAQEGVAFMTMHLTADRDIYEVACNERKIPVTSRGGKLLLLDMKINNRQQNIYLENLNEIIEIVKKYSIVISIGTTFRPASTLDACDKAHIMETKRQIELCNLLHQAGVPVIVENVGHIGLDKLIKHSSLLRKMEAPIMPLGPIPTDDAIGYDHIAAAIGASFMAHWHCAHIINAISPSEHLNSLFTLEDMKNAISSAHIVARTINLEKFGDFRGKEKEIYTERANIKSCVLTSDGKCNRCSNICPLKL